jgi:hypothetical protein
MFMMFFFFAIPKGVLKMLDYYRSRFFWDCDDPNKKYRLAKCSILFKPRCMRGLGILNLEVQNSCLLGERLFKLLNEEGFWQDVLKMKYVKDKCSSQVVKRSGDCHFWACVMDVKDLLLQNWRFKVNSDNQTRFWEDIWIDQKHLKLRFLDLYRIVRTKGVTVAEVLTSTLLNISFRRAIVSDNLKEWLRLVSLVLPATLNDRTNSFGC